MEEGKKGGRDTDWDERFFFHFPPYFRDARFIEKVTERRISEMRRK